MHNDQKVMRLAVIISLFLHLFAAGALYLTEFHLPHTSVTHTIKVYNYGVTQPEEKGNDSSKPEGLKNPEKSVLKGSASNTAPDNINLPKASSQSVESVIEPASEDIAWSSIESSPDIGNTNTEVSSGIKDYAVSPIEAPDGEKISLKAPHDYLAGLSKKLASQDAPENGYTLSGEIVSRKIIEKMIPAYPEGVQQDSEVQLKFEVLPDGSVNDNIVIIKKGGPEMDRLSLEALRQWKFDRISSNLIQTGVITFRFILD